MSKRQKWTLLEDKALQQIISKLEEGKKENTIKWDNVARDLQNQDFLKTAKQCRERSFNQLDSTTHSKCVT